jgi:hypothetical protein
MFLFEHTVLKNSGIRCLGLKTEPAASLTKAISGPGCYFLKQRFDSIAKFI